MADCALVYYKICFESVAEEIWPTEYWYTMRYALKAQTMKDDRLSNGILCAELEPLAKSSYCHHNENLSLYGENHMGLVPRKSVFRGLRTTKLQTSLHIHAV